MAAAVRPLGATELRGPPDGPDVYRFDFSKRFIAFVMVLLVGVGAYGALELAETPPLAWAMLAMGFAFAVAIPFVYHFWTRHQWVEVRRDGLVMPKLGLVPYERILAVHMAYRARYIVVTYVDTAGRQRKARISTFMDRYPELEERLRAATPRAQWTRFPLATPYPRR